MRAGEALWIKESLGRLIDANISPVLELGSSTEHFRRFDQPHIDREIHAPLRRRNVPIVTTDMRSGPGIDISGDIYDPATMAKLTALRSKCVLCCNIFEHVVDRAGFAARCHELLAPGGYMVVTVPYSYPYHLDPIDMLYRPAPDQIVGLFPGYETVAQKLIIDTTYTRDILRDHGWLGLPYFALRTFAKLFVPYDGIENWKSRGHRLLWLFRPYKISAVVLRKPS